jgi:hypothetical protein
MALGGNGTRGLVLLVSLVWGNTAFAEERPVADRLVVPGLRVGPIDAMTTEAALAGLLPQGQVKRVLHAKGEGFLGCATEIFSGTPDVVTLDWKNAPAQGDLDETSFRSLCFQMLDLAEPVAATIELPASGTSAWKTAEGIGIGITVSELAEILGEAVTVLVCPCDYGGFIRDDGGRLGEAISLWADYPVGTDKTLAWLIDIANDYALLSSDIPAGMTDDFVVDKMVVTIGPSAP